MIDPFAPNPEQGALREMGDRVLQGSLGLLADAVEVTEAVRDMYVANRVGAYLRELPLDETTKVTDFHRVTATKTIDEEGMEKVKINYWRIGRIPEVTVVSRTPFSEGPLSRVAMSRTVENHSQNPGKEDLLIDPERGRIRFSRRNEYSGNTTHNVLRNLRAARRVARKQQKRAA